MNQCGVINIYLITMSYLFAPSDDDEPTYNFDGELARTTSSGGSNSSLTDKQNEIQLTDLNNQKVPNEVPLENNAHQMMTSIEMSDSD